ncbi:MAG: hypothetical protein MI810_02185 [Flavobacteriales bacterium]|nr:hypothetical protein [Flavobacteriales bacterium]
MDEIKTYQSRKVIWINYDEMLEGKMPESDWICLMTSSESKPNSDKFDKFTRNAIKHGILEFKGHGEFGELLHDWFDETMVIMETMENHSEIDVMTTWHNNESLADAFWQCFFATCLPETTDYDKLKIVCTDLDGKNRNVELTDYLNRFEQGWLPKD